MLASCLYSFPLPDDQAEIEEYMREKEEGRDVHFLVGSHLVKVWAEAREAARATVAATLVNMVTVLVWYVVAILYRRIGWR